MEKTLDPANCKHNGPIHIIKKILKNIMGSATNSEIRATYVNYQEAVHIQMPLTKINHPKPPTPIQVENSTAVRFSNKTTKQE